MAWTGRPVILKAGPCEQQAMAYADGSGSASRWNRGMIRGPVSGLRSRGFWTYVLLQIPDVVLAGLILWLLHQWAGLPLGWAVGLFIVWVVKDLAMYPLVREAFAPTSAGPERLIGAQAIVATPLAPAGLVRLGGELWTAEAVNPHERLASGAAVIVRAIRGLTLLVEPEELSGSRNQREVSHEGRMG